MEKKKSFLTVMILVISAHIYLFAHLKVMEEQIVAPMPTNSSVQINLKNVVLKKQEVVIQEKPKEKVVKKEIKKVLPKTKSQNILHETRKEELVIKEKKVEKEVPKELFKEKIVEQNIKQDAKKINDDVNPEKLKAVENEYLLKLMELIEKNKIYPNSAKRLNQMGKVYLNFTIAKNGKIEDIKIIENSKYKRLNDAALEIITKIKNFEPIPEELNKNSWNITVPVLYQII